MTSSAPLPEAAGAPSGAPREADTLLDVLGSSSPDAPRQHGRFHRPAHRDRGEPPRSSKSATAHPARAQTPSTSAAQDAGRGEADTFTDTSAPAWSRHIRQVVQQAVLGPLRDGSADKAETSTPDEQRRRQQLQHELVANYKVLVVDALGMPADLPDGAPRSFDDLLELAPAILRTQLGALMARRHYEVLSPVQAAAIPLMLEYRDLLCIAPTATGKTLCYVYASMLRLLLKDMTDRPSNTAASGAEEGGGANLNRRQVEAFLQEKIDKGEVCPYCELSTSEMRVCPMTGFPHPSAAEVAADFPMRSKEQRAMRLDELQAGVAEPRVLVLVPNSQLAIQVTSTFRALHCDYRVHAMVRASSADEQRKYLRALEHGVDVLVAAPETILPALYKHKLSLRRVQTLVLDEVDDLVSVNHFEPMKIVLGALPKGALRPQRLLLGASLPPVAYQMIKTRMLLPSHRFVLVDLKAPADQARTASVSPVHSASTATPSPGAEAAAVDAATTATSPATGSGFLTARANLRHLVFMIGRAEKVQKLAWLYETGKLSPDQRTLIFCNSRHNVAYVRDKLTELVPGVHFATLTSHASSTAREGVLKMFRTGVSTALICTDLLSRGIDFQGVVYVVHYDMPADMETWVHRCGRCGRGGHLQGRGYVYTFFQPENIKLAKPLVAYLRQQQQLIPPKLREYAKQSFIDVFNNSLFHHPTRPYRADDPQRTTPVLDRASRRYPDYTHAAVHKHFRPQ